MTKINVPYKKETHSTFTTIRDRMNNHGIELKNYIVKDTLDVFESKLDGIEFRTKTNPFKIEKCYDLTSTSIEKKIEDGIDPLKPGNLLSALHSARIRGRRSFRKGKDFDHPHWPVEISMAATKGIGFREITYLDLKSMARQAPARIVSLSMRSPKMDSTFSSQFGKNRLKVDISSLHCALWGDDMCAIHIDETGFVLQAITGFGRDVIVTPDSLQHTFLELLWKGIRGMPDSVEIYVPNSANNYSRFGLRGTVKLSNKVRLSLNASYNIRGKRGFVKTLTLWGEF